MEIELIKPGSFEPTNHYYPKILNANLHTMVKYFFNMSQDRVINRFCHMNPQTDPKVLKEILNYKAKFLPWAGCDLFHATDDEGRRRMIVVETNSCPSGQKSMPLRDDNNDLGGYELIIKETFLPYLKRKAKKTGVLAVLYDKNYMEASGYAATIAELTNEDVYLIPYYHESWSEFIEIDEKNQFYIKDSKTPIRAAFRYVTQKPWSRLPVSSKTTLLNPILGCLAGGRNKLVASKAYELLNTELVDSGLSIHTPQTMNDISKAEIPMAIQALGGIGVIKNPYSNAGQGVWTILNQKELDNFMAQEIDYDQYIVQSLIGNSEWSSSSALGKLYHVGTLPDKRNQIFAADIRFMVCSTKDGFKVVGCYARRAKKALAKKAANIEDSWEMLGTNLSIKEGHNKWSSDTNRLMLMDIKDFNALGLSLDQMIEAYVQTVLSVIAIDKMAKRLVSDKGKLKKRLFQSLNKDENLQREMYELSKN